MIYGRPVQLAVHGEWLKPIWAHFRRLGRARRSPETTGVLIYNYVCLFEDLTNTSRYFPEPLLSGKNCRAIIDGPKGRFRKNPNGRLVRNSSNGKGAVHAEPNSPTDQKRSLWFSDDGASRNVPQPSHSACGCGRFQQFKPLALENESQTGRANESTLQESTPCR